MRKFVSLSSVGKEKSMSSESMCTRTSSTAWASGQMLLAQLLLQELANRVPLILLELLPPEYRMGRRILRRRLRGLYRAAARFA
jgi:membrane protein required for beta-lactamase induction